MTRKWRPVTEVAYQSAPNRDPDPLAKPIEFALTPAERESAERAKQHLKNNRRRLNERDADKEKLA